MGDVFKNGAFIRDEWTFALEADDSITEGPVFVSLPYWLEHKHNLTERTTSIGINIKAGEGIEDFVDDLGTISAVRLEFPLFSDGRAYSLARLLRERYDFKGEIRASGDVLIDQIPFMFRCGFDIFEITDEPTRKALEQGELPDVSIYMQPTSDHNEENPTTRPWLRQRKSVF